MEDPTHFRKIIGQFADNGGKFYLILFSIRSGSSLLCEDLWAARLGAPAEYFQPAQSYPPPDGFLGYKADSITAYFSQLLEWTPNKIFGFKIDWMQAQVLRKNLDRGLCVSCNEVMNDLFPGATVIHMRRRDKVLQAISAWRALATGRWHVLHGRDLTTPTDSPEYDFHAILFSLNRAVVEDLLWASVIEHLAPKHLVVWYEDFVRQRRETVERIAATIGHALPESYEPSVVLQEMRNEASGRLRDRFLQDLEKRSARWGWMAHLQGVM